MSLLETTASAWPFPPATGPVPWTAKQIEEHRRRDDRGDLPVAQRETTAPFGQPAHDPVGCGEPINRAAA